ncbi:MAG: hydroxymethylbilane synthase [Candidatus Omnitrophica bacterium]|nr:hydroxymethylbilane synthase [Candidatus Omnitrophota bacterium]
MKTTVVVGARGSRLSVCQTKSVIGLLQAKAPGYGFRLRTVTTLGDRVSRWERSDAGIFVKELEEALVAGAIDMAVHSVKDMPSQIAPGLELGAILKREDPRDCLITRGRNAGIAGLRPGCIIGTTSLRRKAQLLQQRPDLIVRDLRGNLDTRIRKLHDGLYDAIIVAAAGLKRLKVKGIFARPIPPGMLLPACGQGALGIEIRAADARMSGLAAKLDHERSRQCVSAERAFLRHTRAGCRMPVAAYAAVKDKRLVIEGMVISLDGSNAIRRRVSGNADRAQELGKRLAREVLRCGGKKILEEIKRDQA